MLDLVPMMLNKSVSLFLVLWLSLTHCIGHRLTPWGHPARPLIGQDEANTGLWLAKSVTIAGHQSQPEVSCLQRLKLLVEASSSEGKHFIFTDLLMTTIKPRPGSLTHGINAHSAVAAAVAGCMMKVNINFYDILFLYRHNYTLNNSYMKDKFYVMVQLLQ